MSLQVTYNTVTIDPVQSWSEKVEAVMASTGKAVTGYRHTFSIRGFFDNSGGAAAGKKTDIDTVVAKMRESGQDLTITQDGTDIRSFDAADVQGTGPWSTFEIPGTDEEMKIGFNVPFVLTITGVTDPPTATAGTTADTYTDTYAYDKQLRRTFTRSGSLSTSSGTSALGKFDGTDPESSLSSSDIGWELDRKESRVDEDDQNLSYTWVYVEAHEKLQTSYKDVEYNISSSSSAGTESWSASGVMRYEIGKEPDPKDVSTLLKNNSAWPDDAAIVSEDIATDKRNNSLSFTLNAEVAYGQGKTLAYEENVETTSVRNVRDFHSLGAKGKDIRQELTRPDVTIVQSGTWVKIGSYPTEPKVLEGFTADQVTDKRFTKSHIRRDVKGKKHAYSLSWVYTIRPLNTTAPGSFKPAVDPTQSTPLDGQKPRRNTGA